MEGGHESMMDLDAVDLGGVECEMCGSRQFYNEMGFYFCTVCNTQSQVTIFRIGIAHTKFVEFQT